jgi:hypothetical protein
MDGELQGYYFQTTPDAINDDDNMVFLVQQSSFDYSITTQG